MYDDGASHPLHHVDVDFAEIHMTKKTRAHDIVVLKYSNRSQGHPQQTGFKSLAQPVLVGWCLWRRVGNRLCEFGSKYEQRGKLATTKLVQTLHRVFHDLGFHGSTLSDTGGGRGQNAHRDVPCFKRVSPHGKVVCRYTLPPSVSRS